MSLSGVLTATAEFVADVLVNQCDRPAPHRILRYFGTTGLPQDLACEPDGVLAISWDRGYLSSEFPSESNSREMCPGLPVYVLAITYDVCWKSAEIDEDGIELFDTEWDADSAMLSDVGDCVARELLKLSCDPPVSDLGAAVIAACRGGAFRYQNVQPKNNGSAARLTWHAYAGPARSGP